jgi:F-type H+-transporting ATPase subunit delta
MAEPITVARPYAEAAFKLAQEKHALEAWSTMLAVLETVVCDPSVAQRIGDPNVSDQQLEALIIGVGEQQFDTYHRNFVQVLVQSKRLSLLPEIRGIFEQLKLEQEGIVDAQIYSAYDLDDAQTLRLVIKLEAKYQRKVRAKIHINTQLIGGVKIVVGDKVFDATVRGKLDAMSAALTY